MICLDLFLLFLCTLAPPAAIAGCSAKQELDDEVSLVQIRLQDAQSLGSRPKQPTEKKVVITAVNPDDCESAVVSVTAPNCNPHFERLQIKSVPMPVPTITQALVKIETSSANPTDWKKVVSSDKPGTEELVGIGIDFAGYVVKAGQACAGFASGDAVWGIVFGAGAYQEYAVTECSDLGLKPSKFSLVEAGVAPAVTLTGLMGLRMAGAPWPLSRRPPRVLVIGGSSGTGHVGIQLAKAFGAAEVITTCSPDNFAFVKSLGADTVIDYHTQNWWEVLPYASVDIIYDCLSLPGSGDHAYDVIADGGTYLTLLQKASPSTEKAALRPSVSSHYYLCTETGAEQLNTIKGLVDQGKLTVHVDRLFYGLGSVVDMLNTSMQGHVVGKLALVIDP